MSMVVGGGDALGLLRRRGRRDVGRGLAPAPDVGGPRTAQDLAQPLEAGDRAGGEEIVDVRERRTHPRGQRLVAGGAGQRVEPDEPVAVATEAGALHGDQRRVAPVPAVGDHDHHAARRSVRRAHFTLNSWKDSPIRVPPAQSVTDPPPSRARGRDRGPAGDA